MVKQIEVWGDGPKPIVAVVGKQVSLICDANCGHRSLMDPAEAWDLGDDLIVAATRLLPTEPVGFTTAPPWMEHTQVAMAMSNRLAVVCDDHGAVFYPGMRMPLDEVMDKAREHWAQQHSAQVNVAEHAEGEDGDAQADHAVPEPEPQTEAVADAHGGGDQVQNDLDH